VSCNRVTSDIQGKQNLEKKKYLKEKDVYSFYYVSKYILRPEEYFF